MELRITSSFVSNLDLVRFNASDNSWGYYLSGIEGDEMPEREVFVANGGAMVGGAIALPTVKPREWQITLTAWGRTFSHLQTALGFISRSFAPVSYASDLPPLLIEARIPNKPWASIRAICIGMSHEENEGDGIFTATCRIKLLSPFPYWRVPGLSATLSIPPVVSANGIAAINFTNNTLVAGTATTATQTRVAMSNTGTCVAGRTDGVVFFFNVSNGTISTLGQMPSGVCSGLAFLPNGQLVGASYGANATLFWNGTTWQQVIQTNGLISNIVPFADGSNRYAVCGMFTSPRKFLFVVDASNHGAVRTEYVDIFSDLTFSPGEFECLDAYCELSNIVAVGRNRNVSPHIRLVRVGNEFGRSDIASWNHMIGGNGNAPMRIAGFSLHDLIVGGTMLSMNVGVTGLRRVVRVRTLGGIEPASDVDWCNSSSDGDMFLVKRVGNRIFGFTARVSGNNWLLMWTGGGWVPIAWANDRIFDVAGDNNVVVFVGFFTQVRMYSTFDSPSIGIAAMIEPASLPSGTTYYGSVWTDGNGALVVQPSGLNYIPSHVIPAQDARLGTNYYGLAPGSFRSQSTSNRLLMMILGSASGTQNITANGYYEDWRMV